MASAPAEKLKKSNYVPWLSVGVILLILAAAIAFVTLHLRKFMRAKIIQQDGIEFYAAALVDDIDPDIANDPELSKDPFIRSAAIQQKVFGATRKNTNVVAVRFFDAEGLFQLAIPPAESANPIETSTMALLREFRTVSFFEKRADLSEVSDAQTGRAPLLRALVPLRADDDFIGAAEVLLDGQKVAASLAAVDGDLGRYALLIFLFAGGIITVSLLSAFSRLQKANDLLFERTQKLLRANHELTLSSKTAALGTITAHLIHDLKSPLFGLQSFVSARGSAEEEDWAAAAHSAERMQKIISDVVRILQEDKTVENYELSLAELLSILQSSLGPDAQSRGVHFQAAHSHAAQGGRAFEAILTNRDANIILLVITNIVRNSLQATPPGGEISVEAAEENGSLFLRISDTGSGLPPHVLSNLFTPCRSTKSGGTGLGLAISKQLASQIGAELTLKKTSSAGTTFELRVPAGELAGELTLS
jgi:signal transduction histidine kinase